MKLLLFIVFFLHFSYFLIAQEDGVEIVKDSILEANLKTAVTKPSKVAFYSAILPGLGQASNKKYWKIPIVYAALGTSTYFYVHNDTKYREFRLLFKKKKLDENSTELSFDILQRDQEFHKKKRDGAMLLTIGAYLLQIVEASVDAHLQYHSTDSKLSISPQIIREPVSGNTKLTASFTFKF